MDDDDAEESGLECGNILLEREGMIRGNWCYSEGKNVEYGRCYFELSGEAGRSIATSERGCQVL